MFAIQRTICGPGAPRASVERMQESEHRRVEVVKMGTLTLYEITSEELRQLKLGNPSSTLLTFSLALLSLGAGVGVTLLVGSEIKSRMVSDFLMILTVVTLLGGVILLVLWRIMARRTASVVDSIQARAKAVAAATVESASEITITESKS